MSWCAFYEDRWSGYYCRKIERYVGRETFDRYCSYYGKDCPNHNGNYDCEPTATCTKMDIV